MRKWEATGRSGVPPDATLRGLRLVAGCRWEALRAMGGRRRSRRNMGLVAPTRPP